MHIQSLECNNNFATLSQDDPEIPFTEDDYRRRKPHPNFKEHVSAEKTVMKLGKTVSLSYLLLYSSFQFYQ